MESTDANTLIQFGLAQVPSLESWLKNPSVATGVVQSQVVNCPVSGTLTAVVSDADNNGVLSVNDSVSITANNCKQNTTATMNGSITFTVLALSGNLNSNFYNASLKLTYNNLSAVTSASSLVGNGDITLSASANGVNVRSQSVDSTSFTANATYGATNYSRSLSNFNSTQTMASNTPVSTFKVTSNASGTVASSALSNLKVVISTTVPFVRKSTDAFPSSGQVSLTGASAAKVRLTAQSANSVLIELDANADGIYESSTTKPWTEMR